MNKPTGICLLAFLLCWGSQSAKTAPPAPGGGKTPATARTALNWLESMVRSTVVKGKRYSLVQGYESLAGRCWTYDQALSVMAFAALGRIDLSGKILASLRQIQNPDGSFYFSYRLSDLSPTSDRKYTGSIAWVVMAVNLYRRITGDRSYDCFAQKTLKWLKARQITDRWDPRFGGLSLGTRADVFSTEHNLDSYSAFKYFGGNRNRRSARRIKRFILRQLYDSDQSRFLTGFRDPSRYLDCQSWAILTLGQGFCHLLESLEDHFRVKTILGPDEDTVEGFFERPAKGAPVWSEGTEGAALAFFICGQDHRGDYYHRQVRKMTGDSGGIRYATPNDLGFSTSPSVAGTAWFLFYELKINPFRPRFKTLRKIRRRFPPLCCPGVDDHRLPFPNRRRPPDGFSSPFEPIPGGIPEFDFPFPVMYDFKKQ